MNPMFRCLECSREFPSEERPEDHMLREHQAMTAAGAPQHLCPACSTEFPTAESLEQHRKTAHRDQGESSIPATGAYSMRASWAGAAMSLRYWARVKWMRRTLR